MRRRICCRPAFGALIGILLILICQSPLDARMTESPPPAGVPQTLPKAATTRHFTWEDVNSWRVLRMEGDQEVVDAAFPALRFALELVIDPFRLRKAIESFGIPESWMQYSYRTEEERRRKEAEQTVRCAARGIALERRSNTLEVDYSWVVRTSREDVREAMGKLMEVGRQAGYKDFVRLVELIASFVQDLEYRVQADIRPAQDGTRIHTFGLTMPLETLYNGYGDCDTKSVLFASLLANLVDTRLILVRGANHVFAGVRAEPRPSERYVRLRGESFVLLELTHPWRVGHIPNENWHALQLKQMEIIPLFR